MVSVSCFPHSGRPYLNFTFPQMLLVLGVMVQSLIKNGLWVNGHMFSIPWQLPTKSCFLWLLQLPYGATDGLLNELSSAPTTWQSLVFCVRAPQRIRTWWFFSITCHLWQPNIPLPSLPIIRWVKTTPLLMPYLVLTFNVSIILLLMQLLGQLQFLKRCWLSCR